MRIKVVIASDSGLKALAAEKAVRQVGIDADIFRIDVQSLVRRQPYELGEIYRGARNRLEAARAAHPDAHIVIAVENGIIREGGGRRETVEWYDLAAVLVCYPQAKHTPMYEGWSERIRLPTDVAEETRQRGFETTTIGQVLAERHGGDPADPHLTLTRGLRSRKDFLADAIAEQLRDALTLTKPKEENVENKKHRIRIQGRYFDLPIVEVAPGISIAKIMIENEWVLAECAASALAKLLPAGIDQLVMPGGKAGSLLGFMGQATGLPVRVIKKERKPDMREPILAYDYRSITTDKLQTLYLDGEAIEILRGKTVAVIDDVVSSGGTLDAVKALLAQIDCTVAAVMVIATEGEPRTDVISLFHMPVFKDEA